LIEEQKQVLPLIDAADADLKKHSVHGTPGSPTISQNQQQNLLITALQSRNQRNTHHGGTETRREQSQSQNLNPEATEKVRGH
jgi:hypothetical protein